MTGTNPVRVRLYPNPRGRIEAFQEAFARKFYGTKNQHNIPPQFRNIVKDIAYLILRIFEGRTAILTLEIDHDLLEDPDLFLSFYQGLKNKRNTSVEPDEILNRAFGGFSSSEVANSMTVRFYALNDKEIAASITQKIGNTEERIKRFIIQSPYRSRIGTNANLGRAQYTFIPPNAFPETLKTQARQIIDGRRDDSIKVTFELAGIEKGDAEMISKALAYLEQKHEMFLDENISSVHIILSKVADANNQPEIHGQLFIKQRYMDERCIILYSPTQARIGAHWG
jgi:hypothetical protein